MEIRAVRPGEGLRLRQMRLRALADAPDAFGSTLAMADSIPDSVWHDRAVPAVDHITFIVSDAERGAPWCGMVAGHIDPEQADAARTVWLISMWVEPSQRGAGLGTRLVAAVAAWARMQQASRLALDVMRDNAPAIALYAASGFQPIDPTSPKERQSALRMQRMVLELN